MTDEQYLRIGGTSMSAAVASGLVADILQVRPEWTPNQVKGALMSTARPVPGVGVEPQVDAAAQVSAGDSKLISNAAVSPNGLIDAKSGLIDFTRASWRRASWRRASWREADSQLGASWRASWRTSFGK